MELDAQFFVTFGGLSVKNVKKIKRLRAVPGIFFWILVVLGRIQRKKPFRMKSESSKIMDSDDSWVSQPIKAKTNESKKIYFVTFLPWFLLSLAGNLMTYTSLFVDSPPKMTKMGASSSK